jgi:phage terminase large subunit
MEATFIPTGQKIYFLGLDDPLKLSSISTAVGVLCWYWLEEAYEIRNQEVFDMFDEGLAGRVPDGYFKQITLTFNPWSEFWVKTRLFDRVDPSTELYDPEAHKDIWCGTFTYQMNEWLDEADIAKFEDLKVRDPVRYLVAGLGEWGAPEETIYDLTKIRVDRPLNPTQLYIDHPKAVRGIGLDYGFVNIGVAIVVLVDYMTKQLWVLDELIHQGSTNQEIAKQLIDAGYQNWMVVADSAEQKSKLELARSGIYDIHDSRSGPDSIIYGIQYLRQYEMFIDPKCKELIKEISVYQWAVDNETGEKLEKPADYQQDHALDALRYIVAFVQRNYDYGGVSF